MIWLPVTLALLLIAIGMVAAGLAVLFVHDRWFSHDNILRNFPVLGHVRHLLIEQGPKLRQYIVADNREELPFNRDERDWIYRSADGGNNYFGFGTDDQLLTVGYPIIKHAVFPHGEHAFTGGAGDTMHDVAAAVTLGETHDRRKAWRPGSIVNISAMSYGALGAHAVEALNRGAKAVGCYHNTGEGGNLEGAQTRRRPHLSDRNRLLRLPERGWIVLDGYVAPDTRGCSSRPRR